MWEYSDKLLEHFASPRNLGALENPHGVGRVGDPSCGDFLEIHIRVEEFSVADIGFLCQGCPAAVATSSALTELVRGLPLERAARVTGEEVVRAVDGLPPPKRHCSVLGPRALRAAILDYLERYLRESGSARPA